MAAIAELSEGDKDFLRAYLPLEDKSNIDLPFVTLTWAQSLDGMISLGPGMRTTLSGPETKNMTHFLRLKHDAILIGVGTAIADDPGLNCRCPGATLEDQPQPVIVDPDMRWDLGQSKLLKLNRSNEGKMPWIIQSDCEQSHNSTWIWGERRICVRSHDIFQYPKSSHHSGHHKLPWTDIFQELKRQGIKSVMVEGGANVIHQLLQQPNLIDSTIVTIAPTWLGSSGILASPPTAIGNDGDLHNHPTIQQPVWRQFGNDAVVCGKPKS